MIFADHDLIALLEVDPELGYQLTHEQLERARRLAVARVESVDPGEWYPAGDSEDHTGHLGLLVIDGLATRTVRLGRTACSELLGKGDVLRPWDEDCGFTVADVEVAWRVLEPMRLAVLDHRFAAIAGRWPPIIDVIFSRLIQRARFLAFHLAVSHLTRVDTRVLVTLWFLAERWGRVTSEGVLLPLRLTHQMLAHLIGAQRPSVTTAIGDLETQGLASRRRDGSWLLHGQPPDDLRRMLPTTAVAARRLTTAVSGR